MGRAPALLAFCATAVVVVAWFIVAPHLSYPGHAWNVVLVALVVLPGTMLLVLFALPLWSLGLKLWIATAVLIALAVLLTKTSHGMEANFAKFFAYVFAGWAFLSLFEALSWVVLVACVIPLVDIISVWRGPTHTITQHHFSVYQNVAVAFVVPGGGAAYLGPPDILFFALFLGAAARWGLRVFWTWFGMTFMYGLTVIVANVADVGGLPALPFLSVGFLLANADILWRRLRPTARPA